MASLPSKAWRILREDGVKQLCCSSVSLVERQLCKQEPYYEYKKAKIAQRCDPDTDADIFKVVWISPDEVEYLTGTIESGPSPHHLDHVDFFRGIETFGEVRGGEWDLINDRFKELAVYQGLEQRFSKGRHWKDTEFYQVHSHRIEEYGRSYDCQSQKELLQKLHRVDQIYANITEEGYKTQKELGTCKPHKEITVNIGREGKFIFNGGGRHRLTIAKLIELKQVPVIIKIRHKDWQYVRRKIFNAKSTSQLESKLQSKLNHPDISGIIQSK